MAITVRGSKKKGAQIRIDGDFNIYTAAESKQQLLDALNAHAAFDVNIEAVEEIDTSGVQLLLLMQREARRANKSLTLSGMSPAIADIVALLNLAELSEPSATGTDSALMEASA